MTKQLKPYFAGTRNWADAKAGLDKLPWGSLFRVNGLDTSPVRWWAVAAILGSLVVVALSWPTPALAAPATPPLIIEEELRARDRLKTRRRVAWVTSLATNGSRVLFVIALLWILSLVAFVTVPQQEQSVWMPRYLGFVWPAFAIIVCVLLRRIPLLPIRWTAILLLIGVNLANFYARLEHGEPPTARIAQDQVALGDRRTARMFAPFLARTGYGGPGSGVTGSLPNSYYYSLFANVPTTPSGSRGLADSIITRSSGRDNAMRTTIARDRNVTDVYVWAVVPFGSEPDLIEKRIADALGADWHPVDPKESWTSYEHWTWRRLFTLERHHWTRNDATTKPTTRSK